MKTRCSLAINSTVRMHKISTDQLTDGLVLFNVHIIAEYISTSVIIIKLLTDYPQCYSLALTTSIGVTQYDIQASMPGLSKGKYCCAEFLLRAIKICTVNIKPGNDIKDKVQEPGRLYLPE